MSKVINSALELIGNTPLLNASRYAKNAGIEGVTLLTKLEYLNPAGSVKDRVALAMIEDAEKKGELKPGAMIIEPTSGNTGIGLAAVAVAKGYRAVLTLQIQCQLREEIFLRLMVQRLFLQKARRV